MKTRLNLIDKTKGAESFVTEYERVLRDIVFSRTGQYPGMAVTAISNFNLLGEYAPASVLNSIDNRYGVEVPGDAAVLGEALKRVDSLGLIRIEFPERIVVGEFIINYNFIRGFKPKRAGTIPDVELKMLFDPYGFHYGKKEVEPEVFATEKLSQTLDIDFMFNRYPFVPYHFLFVPNRKSGHNQFLDPEKDREIIESAWHKVHDSGLGLGVRLCYNSNGAHASVNHLHFQGFFLVDGLNLPIEKFLVNGEFKEKGFYMKGVRFIPERDAVEGLTAFIKEMNDRSSKKEKIAYCFYMTPKGIVCFPRKHQGDKHYSSLLGDPRDPATITTGFAFYEMLGEILTPNRLNLQDANEKKRVEERIRDIFGALEYKVGDCYILAPKKLK